MADRAYLCEAGKQGVEILECRGYDSLAVVPEKIDGVAVTALAPYLFSAHENYNDIRHPNAFWQSSAGHKISQQEAEELPKVKGDFLEELRLPSSIRKVGAYGFYNCERLRKLELYSTTLDWGAGVFTGCVGIEELIIHVDESRKSCLKEILTELRQTLQVFYDGKEQARLVFSEFFEEAVENTPARILVTNTHGCGQKYRNAFVQTQFQFQEYDSLFPHIQVQESERLAVELALGRVMYPCQLTEKYEKQYKEYLKEHWTAAVCYAIEKEDIEALVWLTEKISYDAAGLKMVIEIANQKGNISAVSLLMNLAGGQRGIRRRFVL